MLLLSLLRYLIAMEEDEELERGMLNVSPSKFVTEQRRWI